MALTIRLRLGHFLYNAGLLGLTRILQGQYPDGTHWSVNGSRLSVSPQVLTKLHTAYCDQLIETFGSGTRCQSLLERFESLRSRPPEDWGDFCTDLKKAIDSRSYKAAIDIAHHRGDRTDIDPLSKSLARARKTDVTACTEIADTIVSFLRRHRDIFMLKDIIYNCVQPFWAGVSFFHRDNTRAEIDESYRSYFVDRAIKYLENPPGRGSRQCQECGSPLNSGTSLATSWIADFGTDTGKKTSDYFRGIPDTFVCPICAIVYSCTPLGFHQVKGDSLFVNSNTSIGELSKANNVLTGVGGISNITEAMAYVRARIARMVTQAELDQAASRWPQNIQVIRRKRDKGNPSRFEYRFELLARDKLQILQMCSRQFNALLNAGWTKPTSRNGHSVNVYDETVSNLLNGKQQYPLIHQLLEASWRDNGPSWPASIVLRIQVRTEGGSKMDESTLKQVNFVRYMGEQLREQFVTEMGGAENAHNRLRGYAYYLLNALKGRDVHRFLDTVVRMYVGIGKPMPSVFAKGLADEQLFLRLGYAYIIGLKGETKNDQSSKVENSNSADHAQGGVES